MGFNLLPSVFNPVPLVIDREPSELNPVIVLSNPLLSIIDREPLSLNLLTPEMNPVTVMINREFIEDNKMYFHRKGAEAQSIFTAKTQRNFSPYHGGAKAQRNFLFLPQRR